MGRDCFCFKGFIYLFLERGEAGVEGDKETSMGERNIDLLPLTSAPPPLPAQPTGDLARNPHMCPDQETNQRPFGSQAGTQSTEPHQPGPEIGS